MTAPLAILIVLAVLLFLSQVPLYRRNKAVTMSDHLPADKHLPR